MSQSADHTHEDEVVADLTALQSEIGLAKARLLEKGCPPQLIERYINKVKEIALPAILNQDCKGVRAELKNDVRLAIERAAWVLPDEEDEVPTEELVDLLTELTSIEDSINQIR